MEKSSFVPLGLRNIAGEEGEVRISLKEEDTYPRSFFRNKER